jgi:hypothetical protein
MRDTKACTVTERAGRVKHVVRLECVVAFVQVCEIVGSGSFRSIIHDAPQPGQNTPHRAYYYDPGYSHTSR